MEYLKDVLKRLSTKTSRLNQRTGSCQGGIYQQNKEGNQTGKCVSELWRKPHDAVASAFPSFC